MENIEKISTDTIKITNGSTSLVGKNINSGGRIVEEVYNQLKAITNNIGEINERIESIVASAKKQEISTEELASVMDSINISNNQISGSLQEITSGISVQAETFKGLSSVAQNLNSSSSNLKPKNK